jgi:predicted NAD-dependent protein-ADP-ribosyltransferase YbiA (DUF1768 family)
MAINSFTGQYAFLDNMDRFDRPLIVSEDILPGGVPIWSVEQAYYAARFVQYAGRIAMLQEAPDGHVAKELAPQLAKAGEPFLTGDMYARRDILYYLVKAKFVAFPDLAQKLLHTGKQALREGNPWGDDEWGMSPPPPRRNGVHGGLGNNYMGEILMEVRGDLRRDGLFDRLQQDEDMRGRMVEDLIRQAFETGEIAYAAQAG